MDKDILNINKENKISKLKTMETKMINLKIDGVPVTVPEGTTVLEAARQIGIRIPTLCYLKDINEIGACRICLVELKGARSLTASCVLPVSEGMDVHTNTQRARQARKLNLELILSNHRKDCLMCVRNGSCELQALAQELGVDDMRFEGSSVDRKIDNLSPSLVRDPNKCVLCRRCTATCEKVQGIAVIGTTQRGFRTIIEPVSERSMSQVPCINCGQCIVNCPCGAIYEKDDTKKVWDALANPDLHVVVQTAPAVRVALGEEFGLPIGTRVTGKMVTALRRLGFEKVFDTDFTADLTIMEEGYELIDRIKNGGVLPLITSCSPGWIKYCEHYEPEMLDNISSCKSPQMMMGALIKTYYAEKNGIDPSKVFSVSVMPCTAKKYEITRSDINATNYKDIDVVLTTREFARMLKMASIDLPHLPEGDFDELLGESTGAGAIFGATGGVMEAALRTVADLLEGKELPRIEYQDVRGVEGVKEATIQIGEMDVHVAVAHSIGHAKKLLDMVKKGEKKYHFIEIMACPGGCVCGGGQPILPAREKMDKDPRALRAAAIYSEDEGKQLRKSHKNPSIIKVYEDFLGEPGGHRAHELLHTPPHHQRPKYND